MLEFVVEPEEGQRDAGHVEARDEFADLGLDDDRSGRLEQTDDAAEDDEQLLVLDAAEAVEDRHDPGTVRHDAGRELGEQAVDEQLRETGRARDVRLRDAPLAVDAHADRHAPLRDREERFVGARERAAGEGDTEAPRPVVRALGEGGDGVEVVPALGRGAGDLEHAEVPGDPATLVRPVRRCAGDVVGHPDRADRDAPRLEGPGGGVEVEHVAGVVAVGEEDSPAVVDGGRHRGDLLGARAGEEVPHRRARREAVPHEAAERRVVAGATADDEGDGAVGARGGAGDPAVHLPDPRPVRGDEPVHHLVGEVRRVVVQPGHARVSARSDSTVRMLPVSSPLLRRASTTMSTLDSSMKNPTTNIGSW